MNIYLIVMRQSLSFSVYIYIHSLTSLFIEIALYDVILFCTTAISINKYKKYLYFIIQFIICHIFILQAIINMSLINKFFFMAIKLNELTSSEYFHRFPTFCVKSVSCYDIETQIKNPFFPCD